MQDFSPDDFKNNVLALADVAKYFKLPTILTTSFEDGRNGPLVPELKELFPDAPYIARPGNINAWDNEDFVNAVKATGKKTTAHRWHRHRGVRGVSPHCRRLRRAMTSSSSPTPPARSTRPRAMPPGSDAAAGAQLMTWFGVACELHRDWRNDIEGLGTLFSNRLPSYRCLINSYLTAKGAAKK